MKRILDFLKKDPMLWVAVLAAIVSFFITPPSLATLKNIDWKTLATLFMLLLILDGFKSENLFLPVIRLTCRFKTRLALTLFLVFGVFFSSMFVTNDVSLIIFVPLTIILFRASGKERALVPVIVLENIAAIRGSLLTPFGSPQNLFLFSKSDLTAGEFIMMMLPLWLMSIILIIIFAVMFQVKNPGERLELPENVSGVWLRENRPRRIVYTVLFTAVIVTIVTRTSLWPLAALGVAAVLLIFDRRVFLRVDYALLGTFLCFFIFSSSITGNEALSEFLSDAVAGHEYAWSIGLSQLISNVPAAIVLYPFSTDIKPLIYGLDTAGLVDIIGSLASVICLRIYNREYPGEGGRFILVFEIISLAFFAVVAPLQLLLL